MYAILFFVYKLTDFCVPSEILNLDYYCLIRLLLLSIYFPIFNAYRKTSLYEFIDFCLKWKNGWGGGGGEMANRLNDKWSIP